MVLVGGAEILLYQNRLENQPWELTAKNASEHYGRTIKPYEIPKKGEGGVNISFPTLLPFIMNNYR